MRYTAVFEFDEPPRVKASDGWLGGKLCAVSFQDELRELENLQDMRDEVEAWRERFGDRYEYKPGMALIVSKLTPNARGKPTQPEA